MSGPVEVARAASAGDVQRCPYCHASVGEAEEQVACKQCLARHHRACWDEGHRCASCSATTPLVQPGETVGSPVAPIASAPDDVRREASRLLEEVEQKEEGFGAALLAYPTLGIYPIVHCENALGAHARQNADAFGPLPPLAEDLKNCIEAARERALSRKSFETRQALTVVAYVALAIALLAGFVNLASSSYRDQDTGLLVLTISYFALQALLVTYLHAFREAVRRHEYDQFYARLVADAVPPQRIKEIAEARSKAWSKRRTVDVVASIFGVLATPVVLLPLFAARARGALALHVKHEEQLVGRGSARKDAP